MELDTLPVLCLTEDKARFAQEIGDSFKTFGFALVKDHGIDQQLIDDAWKLTEVFFALPDNAKREYFDATISGARGYTPFKTEIAKGAKAHDLKEFWHVGRDVADDSPLRSSMPPNIWPTQIPGFQDTLTRLYQAFDDTGATILSRIALYLGLPERWFDRGIDEGNSVLRLLHYPPVDSAEGGAIRAGAHEDINLITLLLGAEEAGLELLTKDGRWLNAAPPPGALVINVGDMLQRLTNHVLPSTTHRVRNPETARAGHSRYSMPFFLHLRSDFPIETLPECISPANPDRYPVPITADDYLQERLREIGLKQ